MKIFADLSKDQKRSLINYNLNGLTKEDSGCLQDIFDNMTFGDKFLEFMESMRKACNQHFVETPIGEDSNLNEIIFADILEDFEEMYIEKASDYLINKGYICAHSIRYETIDKNEDDLDEEAQEASIDQYDYRDDRMEEEYLNIFSISTH